MTSGRPAAPAERTRARRLRWPWLTWALIASGISVGTRLRARRGESYGAGLVGRPRDRRGLLLARRQRDRHGETGHASSIASCPEERGHSCRITLTRIQAGPELCKVRTVSLGASAPAVIRDSANRSSRRITSPTMLFGRRGAGREADHDGARRGQPVARRPLSDAHGRRRRHRPGGAAIRRPTPCIPDPRCDTWARWSAQMRARLQVLLLL